MVDVNKHTISPESIAWFDEHIANGVKPPTNNALFGWDSESAQEAPHTFVNVAAHPIYDTLNSFHQTGARTAEVVLNLGESFGYLNLASARRMIDFGAGAGGPTLALVQLAQQNGGVVEAVDNNPVNIEKIVENGVVDANHAYATSGIDLLHQKAAQGEHYDLVTAFMLGPDANGLFTAQLLQATGRAVAPGGHLVITSDVCTVATARRVCDQQGFRYNFMPAVTHGPDIIPGTLIVSFAGRNQPQVPLEFDKRAHLDGAFDG